MNKNLYTHLESTLKLQLQLLAEDGNPLDLDDVVIKFGVAEDSTGITLAVLDLQDGIIIVDPNQAIIEITFTPKKVDGFTDRDLIYQVQVTINQTDYTYVALEGRIFVSPSLFD